jgi:hypothetical protein
MIVIPLSSEFIASIIRGDKTTTIRRGRRSYTTGRCILRMGDQDVTVEIGMVRFCKVRDLTQKDAETDGFMSLEELSQALNHFYPGLRPDDDVTVVNFECMRGDV